MSNAVMTSLAHQIDALYAGGSVLGLSDRQLVERIIGGGGVEAAFVDEVAFAALVARHGPMVLSVCRQLLDDHHDAEDAFQATFLVLARRARSIRDPDVLGAWLHGVALRTARQARARRDRRRRIEEAAASGRPEARPDVQARSLIDREHAEALHTEIARLPEVFRLAVVSCYLEGLSPDEAARRLRWSGGTLRSRLVRARERLRRGLLGRGIALSTTAIAELLTSRSADAAFSVSPLLREATARAAIRFAARASASASAPAAELARKVLGLMFARKLITLTVALLMLATAGHGYLAIAAAREDGRASNHRHGEPPGEPGTVGPRQTASQPRPDEPPPAPGRMLVTGRVLDSQGRPVAGASTMALASLKWPGRGDRVALMMPTPVGQATADGSGRFRLDAARVSSGRNYYVGVVAVAPGHGAGWAQFDPDENQPAVEIRLRPEQILRGQVFDVQGRPVQGLAIRVESMGTVIPGAPGTIEETEGPYVSRDSSNQNEKAKATELTAWPRPGITDANGRFTIRGIGRGIRVRLIVDDPRFTRLHREVDTDADADSNTDTNPGESAGPREVAIAVEPARTIAGRVTFADTGKPAAHAVIDVSSIHERYTAWDGEAETDGQGRFRVRTSAASRYLIGAFPPDHSPYLHITKPIDWPKGALEQSVDLVLPRGVRVRGRVVEEGSNRPVAGARVGYVSNPDRDATTGASNTRAATSADGSFELGAMPGPGYLTVLGPGEDYVLRELGQRQARAGAPGGERMYAHAFHRLELKPGDREAPEAVIAIRPALAVQCQVLAPDGRPVREARAFSRATLMPLPIAWLRWIAYYHGTVRDGHFTVRGLPADAEVPVSFLDPEHNLGATVRLSSRPEQKEPVTVRLEPLGSATARLVDPAGRPVVGSRDGFGSQMTMLVVTPGRSTFGQDQATLDQLEADEGRITEVDPVHYSAGLASDDRGILHLPALIPGATYRIYDDTAGQAASPRLRREFTVAAGATLHLGDILIERPKAP